MYLPILICQYANLEQRRLWFWEQLTILEFIFTWILVGHLHLPPTQPQLVQQSQISQWVKLAPQAILSQVLFNFISSCTGKTASNTILIYIRIMVASRIFDMLYHIPICSDNKITIWTLVPFKYIFGFLELSSD